MSKANLLSFAFIAGASLTLNACTASEAQDDQMAAVAITTEQLAPGVAVMMGAGGNMGLSFGEDGTVLIDDEFAPLTKKIEAAIAAAGGTPVKFLINTHWHYDHSGGNENFGNAGALIFAQDNVRTRMAGEQTSGNGNNPASPKAALPVVTFDGGMKLHLNGDDLLIMHMPNGHTDGDSVIYWKKANVLHTGDLYFNKVTLPFIDLKSGGNAKGMLAAADTMLAMINDDTKIIPGHGPVASKADYAAYRDMLKDVIGKVETAKAAGKSLADVQAMKPAAKYDTNPDAFIKGDAFVEAVYNSL